MDFFFPISIDRTVMTKSYVYTFPDSTEHTDNFVFEHGCTDMFPVGTEVGIKVDPFDIQIMKKPESEDEEAPAVEE